MPTEIQLKYDEIRHVAAAFVRQANRAGNYRLVQWEVFSHIAGTSFAKADILGHNRGSFGKSVELVYDNKIQYLIIYPLELKELFHAT